jgi:hypothetical protein
MNEEYDLNYFLLYKKKYVKIINYLDGIIENLKLDNDCDEDDINWFIKKRNTISDKLEVCLNKIKNLCVHEYVNDEIDIDPERSQSITYCVICEHTL